MIKKDVKTALKMAQAAWKTEREPADALLFAEAAVRSGLPEQASALLQWQSETGYRDPDLDRLIMEIRQATPSKERR